MLTLTLSANSLAKSVCGARFFYYRLAHGTGRKPAGGSPGSDAGSCVHEAWAVMNRQAQRRHDAPERTAAGAFANYDQVTSDLAEQEAALAKARTERPMLARANGDPDWCTLPYLTDALAQLRSAWGEFARQWRVVECERRGYRTLGTDYYAMHPGWVRRLADASHSDTGAPYRVSVRLEYVRDLVLQHRTSGEVWIVDLKTASKDRHDEAKCFKTSDQFKLYCWAWNDEHPEQPCAGAQPVRLIMRPPLKKAATERSQPRFEVLFDHPVRHAEPFLAQFRRHTLDRAATILRRDPDDLDAWPLVGAECQGSYGACEYLGVCDLRPESRLAYLATDGFVASDAGKRSADEAHDQPDAVNAVNCL